MKEMGAEKESCQTKVNFTSGLILRGAELIIVRNQGGIRLNSRAKWSFYIEGLYAG